MKSVNIKKQKGFTLAELVVVMLVIGLLLYGLTTGFGRFRETSKETIMKSFILDKFPSAVSSHIARIGTIAGITKTDIVNNGAKADTPWGDSWTVTGPVNSRLTLTIPLVSSSYADVTGSDLVSSIISAKASQIVSISYDSTSKNLTLVVQGA